MIRKMVVMVAAILIWVAPGAAQTSPAPPAKKPAAAAPTQARRTKVARAPRVEWPELPDISIPEIEFPALPELPVLPELPDLPALPDLSALPVLPAVPAFPAIELGDSEGRGGNLQEQAERSKEQAERAKEKAERDRERAAEQKERERDKEQDKLEREEDLYDDGLEAMDEGRWERAADKFAQVAEMKGKKADSALYWKAYSEHKAGHQAEAITTLTELQKKYPKSSYLKDAKALEIEVRAGKSPTVIEVPPSGTGPSGRPPSEEDCELKVLAINSLMNQDSERAVPLLEKFLQAGSSSCPKVRKQALFVLAQSGSPRGRAVIEKVARGQLVPELQREAINYLGLFGGHEGRAVLKEIYESSNDNSIKKRILQSFMVSGEKEFLLGVARKEKDSDLRAAAVQQLGVMGAREELWQMFEQEITSEVKAKIINALFVGGDAEHMIQLAKSEKDADLRKKAINNLGLMGGKRTGDALVELYTNEKDTSVRKAVLNAFFLQGNCRQLVDVARKETDQELKRGAVQKLSLMNCKEGLDFLMELLNKP